MDGQTLRDFGEWADTFKAHGVLEGDETLKLEIVQEHHVYDRGHPERRTTLKVIWQGIALDQVDVYDDGERI